jgi:hypothetical protein
MHLVGYFHSCITMQGFMNVKFIAVTITMAPIGPQFEYTRQKSGKIHKKESF